MNKVFTLFLFFFYSCLANATDLSTVDGATDLLVQSLVDPYAQEYRKARKIHYPKGNTHIAIVFFSIEYFGKGNNHTQYLAVFEPNFQVDDENEAVIQPVLDHINKYRLIGYAAIGGNDPRRGSVDFSNVTLDKNLIKVHRKEYGKNDALCCPSISNTITFRIEDRGIYEEIKPNPSIKRDALKCVPYAKR